jgi:D-arabinose 1-dehydrogenase-like Zn-dependent alcohol dehydrogenase
MTGTERLVDRRELEQVNDCFEEIEKGAVDARLVFDFRS